jgi:hypothetical protein
MADSTGEDLSSYMEVRQNNDHKCIWKCTSNSSNNYLEMIRRTVYVKYDGEPDAQHSGETERLCR